MCQVYIGLSPPSHAGGHGVPFTDEETESQRLRDLPEGFSGLGMEPDSAGLSVAGPSGAGAGAL